MSDRRVAGDGQYIGRATVAAADKHAPDDCIQLTPRGRCTDKFGQPRRFEYSLRAKLPIAQNQPIFEPHDRLGSLVHFNHSGIAVANDHSYAEAFEHLPQKRGSPFSPSDCYTRWEPSVA